MASDLGNHETMALLIEEGADVDAITADDSADTPLDFACGDIDGVKLLLAAGADVNFHPRHRQWSTLLLAANCNRSGTLELLIRVGADVNARCWKMSYTPLYLAGVTGNLSGASLLLDYGADVMVADSDGCFVLEGCTSAENTEYMLQVAAAKWPVC